MLKITCVTIGNKMPAWVTQACQDYLKRLADYAHVSLIEIPLKTRGKTSDLSRILDKEMQMMKAAIPSQAYTIALTIPGKAYSSEALSVKLENLQQHYSHFCFLIGGPEGLSQELIKICHEEWSLSKLTLPHPLVRVIVVEALYRAFSISHNHPYHK